MKRLKGIAIGAVLMLVAALVSTCMERSRLDAALTAARDTLATRTDSLRVASARVEAAERSDSLSTVRLEEIDAERAAERAAAELAIERANARADETADELTAHLASDTIASPLFAEHLVADSVKEAGYLRIITGLESRVAIRDSVIVTKDLVIDSQRKVITAWEGRYSALEAVNAIHEERAKGGIRLPLGIRIPEWVGYTATFVGGVAGGVAISR